MKKVYIVFSDFTDIGLKEIVAVYSEQADAEAHVKQLYAELEEDTSLTTCEKVSTKYYFQIWEVKTMRYWKVESGNGLCGCDDEWLMEQADEPTMGDIMECYVYATGYAGQENDIADYDDEEEYWDEYETNIMENTSWEEITKEEFIELRDEEGWGVR